MVVGGQGGESHSYDAFARALGAALSVPLALITVATPHGQDVTGAHGVAHPHAAATALCREIVRTARPVIVHDVRRRIAALEIAAYAGVPILVGGVAVGAVAALDHRVRAWSEQDVELLRGFADAVATAIAREVALEGERALIALLLRCAVTTHLDELLDVIARHVGWDHAELVTTLSDPLVRDASVSGWPNWQADATRFAIAIPDGAGVLVVSRREASSERDELARIAPALAAMVGAILRRAVLATRDRRTGELEVLALHDELTGLLNRGGFFAIAGGQLAVARRQELPGIIHFIDVDGLKQVNDRGGHSAGDALLRLAAGVLRATFPEADTIARMGGDEFVVFTLDASDQDLAAVVDRLSSELARANETTTQAAARLSWSVGCVSFDATGTESLDSLVAEADRRMYAIKRLGNA